MATQRGSGPRKDGVDSNSVLEKAPFLSLHDAVEELARGLQLPRGVRRTHVAPLLDRIQFISVQKGFTSKEATQVLQLALRGTAQHLPATNVSSRLLKSIRPAKGYLFGEAFVLTVLGALGGAGEKVVDRAGLRLAVEEIADEEEQDSGHNSSGEESGHDDHSMQADKVRRRKKIDVKVQGLALRLLVLLLSPPPISPSEFSSEGPLAAGTIPIPSSFMSVKARRTLDRCYGVLFHYLEYQTLR